MQMIMTHIPSQLAWSGDCHMLDAVLHSSNEMAKLSMAESTLDNSTKDVVLTITIHDLYAAPDQKSATQEMKHNITVHNIRFTL